MTTPDSLPALQAEIGSLMERVTAIVVAECPYKVGDTVLFRDVYAHRQLLEIRYAVKAVRAARNFDGTFTWELIAQRVSRRGEPHGGLRVLGKSIYYSIERCVE